MNQPAYDISHLLEAEAAMPAVAPAPALRAVKARPAAGPDRAQLEALMARELLRAAAMHDDWVRQYLATAAQVETADTRH